MTTQNDAVLFLRRIRRVVGAHLSCEECLAVRRQYGLSEIRLYGQGRLLQMLSNLKAVSDSLEDTALKLSRKVATTAETLSQVLREGLKKRRYFKAEKISLRQERLSIIKQLHRLCTKIYAFLMESMPDGSRAMSVWSILAFGPPSCAEISAQRKRSLLSQKPRPQKS